MYKKLFYALGGLLVLTALAACVESGNSTGDTAGSTVVADNSAAPVATPASAKEVTVDATETPAERTAVEAEPHPTESTAQMATQFTGTWFALFGLHDNGVVVKAWEEEQRLQLNADGTGSLVKAGDGPWDSLFVKWQVVQGNLVLSFLGGNAVASGLSRIAPLGIARDEETGLLPLTGSGNINRWPVIGEI